MNVGGEYKRAPEEERMELDRDTVMVPGVIGVSSRSKRVDAFWVSAVICALSIYNSIELINRTYTIKSSAVKTDTDCEKVMDRGIGKMEVERLSAEVSITALKSFSRFFIVANNAHTRNG